MGRYDVMHEVQRQPDILFCEEKLFLTLTLTLTLISHIIHDNQGLSGLRLFQMSSNASNSNVVYPMVIGAGAGYVAGGGVSRKC